MIFAAFSATAGGQFSLLLNKMPPLRVGGTTFLTGVDYTSVDNVPGVLVQVTGGYDSSPPSSRSFSAPLGPAWSYNVQLFKDGDEFPIDSVVEVAKISDRVKCGCIKFVDTEKRISSHGGEVVLVTDQPGFNTTIHGRSLIDSGDVADIFVRLSSVGLRGERGAELTFYVRQKQNYPRIANSTLVNKVPESMRKIFVKEGGKVGFPYVGEYRLDSIVPANRSHSAWVTLVPVN